MHAAIKPMDPAVEYFFAEGCHINELSNSDADSEVSIARARVAPGVTTRWYRLMCTTERYVLLSGKGRVEVGELPPQAVGPGDVVLIPPGCRQRITCLGDEELVFLAICTPRFRPEAYEDMGDSGRLTPGARAGGADGLTRCLAQSLDAILNPASTPRRLRHESLARIRGTCPVRLGEPCERHRRADHPQEPPWRQGHHG